MSNYDIAREIKPIKYETLKPLYLELIKNQHSLKPLSTRYNNIADYFTKLQPTKRHLMFEATFTKHNSQ